MLLATLADTSFIYVLIFSRSKRSGSASTSVIKLKAFSIFLSIQANWKIICFLMDPWFSGSINMWGDIETSNRHFSVIELTSFDGIVLDPRVGKISQNKSRYLIRCWGISETSNLILMKVRPLVSWSDISTGQLSTSSLRNSNLSTRGMMPWTLREGRTFRF